MTAKRYRKLLRAEFTAVYLRQGLDREWMAQAYRLCRHAGLNGAPQASYAAAYEAIKNALR